jgi:hypothetical protein
MDREELIEEIIRRSKKQGSLFGMPKDPATKGLIALVQSLNDIPKTSVPMANFERVKNQILDRIALPKAESVSQARGFFVDLPAFLKIGGAVLGSFLILISLGVGVTTAAIQSVPGQPIYPVKKAVETVQLRLASTDAEKAKLQIKFANNRLEELEKVLEKNQQGKVSGAQVQKIVEETVNNIAKTATTVSEQTVANADSSQTQILSRLVDLSNKQTALLQTASIKSEGEIKMEIDKALVTAKDSQDQTLENIEKAGLKVENAPITITDSKKNEVQANGSLTKVSATSVTVGSSEFLLTKDTKFANIKQDELKVGQVVSIKGQIIQSKTYALEVTFEKQGSPVVTPPPPTPPSDNDSSGQ